MPSGTRGLHSAVMTHPTFSAREEWLHSLTHGAGALLSIAALTGMVVLAASSGDPLRVVAAAVFGGALVLMYTTSTVYHAVPARLARAKQILQLLDHCCIYLLIAGTYTPFTLITLQGPWGWSLFGVVWSLAMLGVALKLIRHRERPWLSNLAYLATGWVVVIALEPLVATLPAAGLWLLVAGGLAYSFGVVFYAWESLPYNHIVWHLFVLAGSTCHYLAVQLYVIT